jgi:hypothetical protein
MAAKRVNNDADPDVNRAREAAVAHWSRCEAALIGSRVTVAASDMEGRYTWIFNAPGELPSDLVGRLDREVLSAEAATALAAAKAAVLERGEAQQLELELTGDRGPRWYHVTIRPHFDRGSVFGTGVWFRQVG